MENLAVKLKDIVVNYGMKEVLRIEEINIYQLERIGIVGGNGQGKSTLLKLIAGVLQPEHGTIQREIDFQYFPQIAELDQVGSENLDFELMSRLHVPHHDGTFSGGEESKFRLAQVLSQYEQGLLLDEPTTHLGADSVETLIEELRYYYGTLLFVSHNRQFLNEMAEKIWEVEDGKVTQYVGNYDAYRKQKELQALELERQQENYLREKQRLSAAAQQKKEQAAKMSKKKHTDRKPDRLASSKQKDTVQKSIQKVAKAIEKRMEQLEEVKVEKKYQKITFPTSPALELHNPYPIRGERVTIQKGNKVLFEDMDFQFQLGKKTAIIGKNGIGKSSLLQHILAGGDGIVTSPKVVFATYQQMDYKLAEDDSILAFLMKHTEFEQPLVRSILHNLGFSQEEVNKPVKNLSGGEATRVSMALLFVRPSNVLILDEPTNFIDLATIEALENFLDDYPGTVLFTSHDPYFVERIADVKLIL